MIIENEQEEQIKGKKPIMINSMFNPCVFSPELPVTPPTIEEVIARNAKLMEALK